MGTINKNTTCHAILGREPSGVFSVRIKYNVQDLRLPLCPKWYRRLQTDVAAEIERNLDESRKPLKETLLQPYVKYCVDYDKNTEAQ